MGKGAWLEEWAGFKGESGRGLEVKMRSHGEGAWLRVGVAKGSGRGFEVEVRFYGEGGVA